MSARRQLTEADFNLWPVILVGEKLAKVTVTPAGLELTIDGERSAFLDALELKRVISGARPTFEVTVQPKVPEEHEDCPLCGSEPRPTAARDVPVGESWAFKGHRTCADFDQEGA